MAQHKLTDIAVRMLKPKSSSFQVSDGGGLYLKIYPNGAKSWLLRKYSDGKQTNLMLGLTQICHLLRHVKQQLKNSIRLN